MAKGQMTGKPTNIVCWLVGGYFGNPPSVYSIAYDKSNLLDEIKMRHYENDRAKAAGVQILGITMAGAGDRVVFETYKLVYSQEEPPAFAVYIEESDYLYEDWTMNPQNFIAKFKQAKGYDLPNSMLDPDKATPEMVENFRRKLDTEEEVCG